MESTMTQRKTEKKQNKESKMQVIKDRAGYVKSSRAFWFGFAGVWVRVCFL